LDSQIDYRQVCGVADEQGSTIWIVKEVTGEFVVLQISWVILFGYSKRLQEEDVYDTPMFWAV
jgi:hypothetical protein